MVRRGMRVVCCVRLDRGVSRIVRRHSLRDLGSRLEVGNMRCYDFGLPFLQVKVSNSRTRADKTTEEGYAAYVLQICKDIFADTILIEFGPYTRDNVVNDCAIYSRLISCAKSKCRGRRVVPGHTQYSATCSQTATTHGR